MKVTIKEALKRMGRTNWAKLQSMTDEETEQAIANDLELRELTCTKSTMAKQDKYR